MAAVPSENAIDFKLEKYPVLRPLFCMVFLESLGMALSTPVIPFFIMDEMGATEYELGISVTAFSLTQILGASVFGRCSDAFGRWPVVVFSFIWTAVGCAATAFVRTFNELLVARLLTGISGGTWPICQAYLLDVVEEHDRGNYMGSLAAVFASAWIIGPGTATVLLHYQLVSRRMMFNISALICLAGAFLGGVWLQESLPRDRWRPIRLARQADSRAEGERSESDWEAVNVGLACIWLSRFFIAVAQFVVYSMYAPLLEDMLGLGARALGVLLMLGGIAAVLVQGLVFGSVVRRLGKHEALFLGCCFVAIAVVLMPVFRVFAIKAVILLVFVCGESHVEPATPIVIAAYCSERHLGFANGCGSAFRGVAAILTPLLGGFLYERCGSCAFELAGAAAALAAGLVMASKYLGKEFTKTESGASESSRLV
mmetsp:Transcript_56146/g.180190  ORF Transcript_56146/g.180190 Transcript_56146/m.180190 type:complete len:428 (-) Transcript_56146:222-1505(-)